MAGVYQHCTGGAQQVDEAQGRKDAGLWHTHRTKNRPAAQSGMMLVCVLLTNFFETDETLIPMIATLVDFVIWLEQQE